MLYIYAEKQEDRKPFSPGPEIQLNSVRSTTFTPDREPFSCQ